MSMEPTEQEEAAYEYASLINASRRVIEGAKDLEDEYCVELATHFINFENAHKVAERLIEMDVKAASALASEIIFQIKDKS